MITVVTYLKTPELHSRGCCHSDHILWLFRSTSSAQMAARQKKKQKCTPMSNYLIMENTFFSNFISYHSECSFNSHLNFIQSSLSITQLSSGSCSTSCKNPSVEVLSLQSSFHLSSISLLYPTIPGWQGCAYVCPMNESIFSFQHCLNFQLKMSRVSPDCSA